MGEYKMNKSSVLSYESDLQKLKELKEKNSKIVSINTGPSLSTQKSDLTPKSMNIEIIKEKPTDWKNGDSELIKWFQVAKDLPSTPFQLKPGSKIEDCEKYYASIRTDISAGPKGTRALYGALQDDLKNLKRITEEKLQ